MNIMGHPAESRIICTFEPDRLCFVSQMFSSPWSTIFQINIFESYAGKVSRPVNGLEHTLLNMKRFPTSL